MPVFADFPMLPMGSADDHARYLSQFNYRYYCVMCIRNIESISKLEKCVHCNSTNLILLMEKEVKPSISWQERIIKFLEGLRLKEVAAISGEELPTQKRASRKLENPTTSSTHQ